MTGKSVLRGLAGALVLTASVQAAHSEPVNPPVAATVIPMAIPQEAKLHIQASLDASRGVVPELAISSFYNTLRLSNLVDNSQLPASANNFGSEVEHPAITPTKMFDEMYYIGSDHVGTFVLKTSDGIIMWDAMNNDTEASEIIEAGYRKLGLDPKDIRYIILTHAHGDHNGGANYFKRKYPTIRIISTEADWQLMESWAADPKRFGAAPPSRDMTVVEGEVLTLGDKSITFHVTPGHTPGTLSAIVPVTDNGRAVILGLFGGVGMPMNPQALVQYEASWKRFGQLLHVAGAQGILSTHPAYDGTLFYITDPNQRRIRSGNPWIMGADGVQRYVTAAREAAAGLRIIQAAAVARN